MNVLRIVRALPKTAPDQNEVFVGFFGSVHLVSLSISVLAVQFLRQADFGCEFWVIEMMTLVGLLTHSFVLIKNYK